MISTLIILIIGYTLITVVQSSGCQINPLRIQPTPLIFHGNHQIIYPDSRNHVANISQEGEIFVACPNNLLLHRSSVLGEYIALTCVDNDEFNFRGQEMDFHSLKCHDIPKNTVRYTQKSCAEGGQEVEIGYFVTTNVFLRQIQICFDNINFTPIYSHYNLTSNIGYRDTKVPRKFFEEDGFYTTSESLDNLYRRDIERKTINELLGLDSNSDTYIKQNGELFINRGHLTAKGDFVYAFQQLATFHYVNSAPQWASFNGGNWNELEISVRDYADSAHLDLEIFTGVYGRSSLRNRGTGEQTELFLHTRNGKNLLPVPRVFWKIIYHRSSDSGVVVLGVNNAYEFDANEDVICSDISRTISWFNSKLTGQKHNIELGYIYACSVPDFRRIVNRSPVLNARNLLL